ncbi:hypothetical protein BDV96DRAFT_110631 [Lophiotrema nucula]|uniref:Uncharacterized protein n=1 Tax=Lophiotrema nucula TaxID=690887 RepID=A0A6A5Z419_9PLEO|nr:hypothetical protein BDV96DRAFT_110631 [Lophiotrema nucula]
MRSARRCPARFDAHICLALCLDVGAARNAGTHMGLPASWLRLREACQSRCRRLVCCPLSCATEDVRDVAAGKAGTQRGRQWAGAAAVGVLKKSDRIVVVESGRGLSTGVISNVVQAEGAGRVTLSCQVGPGRAFQWALLSNAPTSPWIKGRWTLQSRVPERSFCRASLLRHRCPASGMLLAVPSFIASTYPCTVIVCSDWAVSQSAKSSMLRV